MHSMQTPDVTCMFSVLLKKKINTSLTQIRHLVARKWKPCPNYCIAIMSDVLSCVKESCVSGIVHPIRVAQPFHHLLQRRWSGFIPQPKDSERFEPRSSSSSFWDLIGPTTRSSGPLHADMDIGTRLPPYLHSLWPTSQTQTPLHLHAHNACPQNMPLYRFLRFYTIPTTSLSTTSQIHTFWCKSIDVALRRSDREISIYDPTRNWEIIYHNLRVIVRTAQYYSLKCTESSRGR